MKIYHYTSIDTLIKIIETRKIKFNRIDKVNDSEEAIYESEPEYLKIREMVFVSCWTKDPEENLILWERYTNSRGVRICLDSDIFVSYRINDNIRSYFPLGSVYTNKYEFSPFLNKVKLYDIEYYDQTQMFKRSLIKHGDTFTALKTNDFCIMKTEKWKDEKESRFKIVAMPRLDKGRDENISKYDIVVGESYVLMPLIEGAFDNIEVTMGPEVSQSEEDTLKSILAKFKNGSLKHSSIH